MEASASSMSEARIVDPWSSRPSAAKKGKRPHDCAGAELSDLLFIRSSYLSDLLFICCLPHAATVAFSRIDRNQESVAVGIGERVAGKIGAVLDGAVQFEPAVVLRAKVLYIPQYDTRAVRARLALQFHRGHFAA